MKRSRLIGIALWVAVAMSLAFQLAPAGLAFADEYQQHPRVSELEQSLSNQASSYLGSRFPGMPFLVSVKIDPLFRNERVGGVPSEQLPYFDLSSEETIDEWDDRSKSLLELEKRVKKIVVNILVPNTLPETEATEIREFLVNFLHLNPARDEVHLNRRNWNGFNINWMQVALFGLGILSFLSGLLWINRMSTNRIAKALEDSARKSSPPPPTVSSADTAGSSESGKNSGDFQMHDPVKLKDLAVRAIDLLCNSPAFPSHQDMYELNDLGAKSPGDLGALLVEFPAQVLAKLVSYSSDENWLKALNEPGVLDFESLNILRKLLRNPHEDSGKAWSEMVISVWRLPKTERINFLKGLDQKEAISILRSLPKSMALSSARQLYPGGWAQVLEAAEDTKTMGGPKLKQLTETAQRLKPLRNLSEVIKYREDQELMRHLLGTDPYEERDIYQVLPSDSRIVTERPPFFRVLDAEEEIRRTLANSFGVEDWARALADVKPTDKQRIESFFSEKQKFLYAEAQRKVDLSQREQQEQVGRLRRKMATYLAKLEKTKSLEGKAEGDTDEDGERTEPVGRAA